MRLHERALLKQATELHVFDFDDTLFDSPVAPENWKGNIKAWWHSPESLSPPFVVEGKERARELPAAAVARNSIQQGAYTVLLTGRPSVPGMQERVEAILEALGLRMDAVLLREASESTPVFKRRMVDALLAGMPKAERVAMWDDMGDNLVSVSKAVADRSLSFDSHLVRAKHRIEQKLPTALEALEFLEMRLAGKVPCEEAKSFPIGTVRKWKGGDYLKTKDGWVKQTGDGQKPAPAAAPVQAAPVTNLPPEPTPAVPQTSRKTNKFGFVEAAKTLVSFLANPDAPENQKAVRELFNALCSDFGMLDRDKGTAGAYKLEQKTKAELPPGVGGVHDWNGTIIVRDKSVARAAKLMEAKRTGAPVPPKAEKGAHVIVHEAVHGHSPIRREQFKGRYRLLEEATTELAARKVMKDTFGTEWSKFSLGPDSYGAYHKFCDSLQQGVTAALGRRGFKLEKPDDWNDFLGETAIEMRRRPPPTDPDKNAYLRRFASSLPIPAERLKQMGGADAVREEVAKAVWLSLKPAREEEKLRTAEAKLVQLGLLDPKNPTKVDPIVLKEIQPYIEGLAKAKKDWSDYLAGGPVTESAVAALLDALREARLGLTEAATDEDAGMLPRNNIELAIAYARVLDRDGTLDGWALRDLAMLQDDVKGALVKLRDAVAKYDLKVAGED